MMTIEKKTEFKVGLTVIIGILLLLWVLGWAKNISLGSEEKTLTVEFNSVAGLELNDIVTINGLKKGFVNNIYLRENKVFTELSLDPEVDLREDASFSIYMLDLMGGKKIEINPGTSKAKMDFSKIQNGVFSGDISTAMAVLSTVQTDLVDVIIEVKKLLYSANDLMNNEELKSEFKKSLNNFNRLTNNLNQFIENNSEEFSSLVSSGNNLTMRMDSLLIRNESSIDTTFKILTGLISDSKMLIGKFSAFMDETRQQENNIGKIVYDEKFYNQLDANIKQLKRLTDLLIKQLENEGLKVDAYIF